MRLRIEGAGLDAVKALKADGHAVELHVEEGAARIQLRSARAKERNALTVEHLLGLDATGLEVVVAMVVAEAHRVHADALQRGDRIGV
jgi:hypothetical protein